MYRPKHVLIQSFAQSLQNAYQDIFGNCQPHFVECLKSITQKSLEALSNSDALYHDLEHTILVTAVGQEILRAKRLCDGSAAVASEDWLNFITVLLCHDIGYLKGVCRRDDRLTHRYVTGTGNEYVTLPPGATDAALTPYHVDRSKQFIAEQFANEPLIAVERVQQMIEFTRFPVSKEASYQETCSYPGLARAADLIGQLGDRHYLQKLPGLFYEFAEISVHEKLGYQHPGDIRAGFPDFYWNRVHPYIQDAVTYLGWTQAGKQIVAELHANIFVVEHELKPQQKALELCGRRSLSCRYQTGSLEKTYQLCELN